GLRLPLEPLPRARPGVPSVEHRLDRDRAVEPQVPGPEDDPHAAAAEDRFDLIAQDARQSRILRRVRGAVVGGREEHIQVGAWTWRGGNGDDNQFNGLLTVAFMPGQRRRPGKFLNREIPMTTTSDLMKRHFETLVADPAAWRGLIADDIEWELA